jgi:hypothetical protein
MEWLVASDDTVDVEWGRKRRAHEFLGERRKKDKHANSSLSMLVCGRGKGFFCLHS